MEVNSVGLHFLFWVIKLDRFFKEGYFVEEEKLSTTDLELLQNCCDVLLGEPIDDGGGNRHEIGLGKRRRFLAHRHEEFDGLEAFILSGTPAKVASKVLGDKSYLFNEQFVVKGAETGASFAWHQDSAYVGYDHKPYVSVWLAIDEANEMNGCLRVLPRNLQEKNYIDRHTWDMNSKEMVGYNGPDEGIKVVGPEGMIVVFSSLTLHCSGENKTSKNRRAYLIQYSSEPVKHPETGELKRFAKPTAV